MNYNEIIKQLKEMGDPKNVEGMARFGINPENNYGNSVTSLRNFAKKIGKSHNLALQLWDSGIHDARMLAAHIDDPTMVTEDQMDKWAKDFNSWDVCDNACGHLFDKTLFAYKKAEEWSKQDKEFVKRAGFAIMAWAAVHDKKADDKQFEKFLMIIKRESTDDRNYVRKAVNWALRNIGKRNMNLNKKAINIAREIQKIDSKTARWIANDAIHELTSENVKKRLGKKRN
jgi:3-methyladenine DNA glycosylase AlkD